MRRPAAAVLLCLGGIVAQPCVFCSESSAETLWWPCHVEDIPVWRCYTHTKRRLCCGQGAQDSSGEIGSFGDTEEALSMEESTGSSSLGIWIPRPSSTKHLWRRGKLLLVLAAHTSHWCCCPTGSVTAWIQKLLPSVFSRTAAGLTQDSLSSSQCGQQHQDLRLGE